MTSPFPLYAFNVLESKLSHTPKIPLKNFFKALNYTTSDPPSPLFITWNKDSDLRGCIGTFSPLPIEKGIAEYSLIAALEDTRFHPITASELPRLSVSVTLLQNFEDGKDAFDWVLGKHGIRISFQSNSRTYSATFLPEVAIEQGWDQEETLSNLIRKAGARFSQIDLDDVKLVRYEGIKSKVDYKEYKEFIKGL